MTQALKLEDILPDKPEFTLKATGKVYVLRLPNASDHVWMQRFGDAGKITAIFTERKWDDIARIVYRLMEDKSDFLARTEAIIDDDGEKKEVRVTGPELLMQSIVGLEEQSVVIGALTRAFSLSNPIVDKYINEELKKNTAALSLVGEKSLTSLPASTDTPSNKLEE